MWNFINFITNFNLDLLIPESLEGFKLFLFSIGGLSLINLWCFIDIIGFLISLYVIKYIKIESKYPKLQKMVTYFANSNYVFIGLQIAYIIVIHLFILIVCISIYFSSFY